MTTIRVTFNLGSGPARTRGPLTVYVRPSIEYLAANGKTILPAPGPIVLDPATGTGVAELEREMVWVFTVSVPGLEMKPVYKYIGPWVGLDSVAYDELVTVSAPPADADGAPSWAVAVRAYHDQVMAVYNSMQEDLVELPTMVTTVTGLRDEAEGYALEARTIAQDIRGRIVAGEEDGPDAGWPYVMYPYDPDELPPAPGGGGGADWSQITNKPQTFAPTIGATATTAVAGNDPRLTDARTPAAHTHPQSEITDLVTNLAAINDELDGKADSADLLGYALLSDATFATIRGPVATDPDELVTLAQMEAAVGAPGVGVPAATTTTQGAIILAGDLAGTATAPTVPGLATRVTIDDMNAALDAKQDVVQPGTISQFLRGDMNWQPLTSIPVSTATEARVKTVEGGTGPSRALALTTSTAVALPATDLGGAIVLTLSVSVTITLPVVPAELATRTPSIMMWIVQGGTGSKTITWAVPSGKKLRWVTAAPTLSTPAGARDWVSFTYDGIDTWTGVLLAKGTVLA